MPDFFKKDASFLEKGKHFYDLIFRITFIPHQAVQTILHLIRGLFLVMCRW
jgi:hypothetical protein